MSLMNTMFDEQLLMNADPDTSGNALPYRQKSSKYMGFVILFLNLRRCGYHWMQII